MRQSAGQLQDRLVPGWITQTAARQQHGEFIIQTIRADQGGVIRAVQQGTEPFRGIRYLREHARRRGAKSTQGVVPALPQELDGSYPDTQSFDRKPGETCGTGRNIVWQLGSRFGLRGWRNSGDVCEDLGDALRAEPVEPGQRFDGDAVQITERANPVAEQPVAGQSGQSRAADRNVAEVIADGQQRLERRGLRALLP